MLHDFPSTHASLLVRIRDRTDTEGWREFVEIYAPLIHGYLRRQSLQDADAADVTQDVLQSVARSPIDYDVERGHFRSWLLTVTRWALHRFRAPRGHAWGSGDTSVQHLLENQVDEAEDTALWELDWQRKLFQAATQLIRSEFQPSTWEAFWSIAILGEDPQAVASRLGLSTGAVYIAKCRVLSRLRREIERLESL